MYDLSCDVAHECYLALLHRLTNGYIKTWYCSYLSLASCACFQDVGFLDFRYYIRKYIT